MNVTVRIPDDLAARRTVATSNATREGFALAEYQSGRLTRPELCRLLGFGTRYEPDGFLMAHGVNAGVFLGRVSARQRYVGSAWCVIDLAPAFDALRTTSFHVSQGLLDVLLTCDRQRRSTP